MKINNETHICFSIIVTGKCNCNCAYCHFYAQNPRQEVNFDIKQDLFERYLDYLAYVKTITPYVSCRLSGGEPLFMGDKVFDLTDQIFEKTGIKPYIMTNGKLLSKEIIEKAKKHNVSSFVVSVENPFDIAVGAVSTTEILKKFKDLQNKDVPLYFGMLVLDNSQYKNMKKIADLFFKETETIPPMCEVNFLPYRSATKQELEDLYQNAKAIVKQYNGKAPISLFPYVIPEYYSGNLNAVEYLTELPLLDKHNAKNKTNQEMLESTEKQLDKSYFMYDCKCANCEWGDSCKRLKWVWGMETPNISKENKLKDYCQLKKVLSQAFFDALVGEE